jgi:hypothetical protein
MKKLKKILINPEKIIKSAELISLRGGYGGSGDCSATTKIGACEGHYEYQQCCWQWNEVTQYGKCVSIYGGPLHCSDLN